MSRRKYVAVMAVLVAIIFFVPIVPATAPSPAMGFNIHYYRSLSSLIMPAGSSYWNGHYYFIPNPLQYYP